MARKKRKSKTSTKEQQPRSETPRGPSVPRHRPPPAILPGVDPIEDMQYRLQRNTKTLAEGRIQYNPEYLNRSTIPPEPGEVDVSDIQREMAQFHKTQIATSQDNLSAAKHLAAITERNLKNDVNRAHNAKLEWLKANGYLKKGK